jgi:gliding motility-associated-like protein
MLLQKKMPIANFQNNNYDSRLQVIEPGMFTGFTTQNITPNATDLHYVQLRNEDTANACFGSDTSFLSFIPVPVSPNISTDPIVSYAASVVHLPINCQVTDLPMTREDLCITKNFCDTLAIHAPDTVCVVNNPVTITVYKNPLCKGRILFNFDTAAVAGYTQPNDTTLLLTFSRSWQGKVIARLASCSLLQDSTDLIVSAPVSSFTLGDDVTYCPGKTYNLEAPAGFIKYEWQNGSSDRVFSVAGPGMYYVKATDFCNRMYSDTVVIKPAGFSLSAGADTTICESESIILNATPGFSNYVWSPSYHISNTKGMQVTVFPNATTSYTIQAEKFPGCILTDTVTVSTKFCPQKFFIANAFSPNGDGINELFNPYITGLLVHYEFTIFNRWGQQLFKTTNRNEGWNGTIKGIYQNNNVFTWFCRYQFINQPLQVRKGIITLIR